MYNLLMVQLLMVLLSSAGWHIFKYLLFLRLPQTQSILVQRRPPSAIIRKSPFASRERRSQLGDSGGEEGGHGRVLCLHQQCSRFCLFLSQTKCSEYVSKWLLGMAAEVFKENANIYISHQVQGRLCLRIKEVIWHFTSRKSGSSTCIILDFVLFHAGFWQIPKSLWFHLASLKDSATGRWNKEPASLCPSKLKVCSSWVWHLALIWDQF